MRHRSVIAFVIIAAALFALPQISQDIRSLKETVGSRLRGELMQAFLNLHTDDAATENAVAPRPVNAMLASCTKGRADAPVAKSKKSEPRASLEQQSDAPTAETARERLALITKTAPRRVETDGEVAMIIPPDSGIDPHAFADLNTARLNAHVDAAHQRNMTDELRRVSYVTTRFEANNEEWRKVGEEALRNLNATAGRGTFEFRVVRDGSKTKVMKFIKRTGDAGHQPAAVPAPRAPRLPGQVARFAPAPGAQSSSEDE
jgi:hypothetical protein